MAKILVAEEDWQAGAAVAGVIRSLGHEVVGVSTAVGAMTHLADDHVDVLLANASLELPGGRGLLSTAARTSPRTRCLVMRRDASVRDYKQAIELGAVDLLSIPFSDADLRMAVARALESSDKFHGIVHGLDLTDILQAFHQSKRSVIVRAGSCTHEIYMRDGEIIHAVAPPLKGRDALRAIVGLTSGSVDTHPLQPSPETISVPFQPLLLDVMRQNDEEGVPVVDGLEDDESDPVIVLGVEDLELASVEPSISDMSPEASEASGPGRPPAPTGPILLRPERDLPTEEGLWAADSGGAADSGRAAAIEIAPTRDPYLTGPPPPMTLDGIPLPTLASEPVAAVPAPIGSAVAVPPPPAAGSRRRWGVAMVGAFFTAGGLVLLSSWVLTRGQEQIKIDSVPLQETTPATVPLAVGGEAPIPKRGKFATAPTAAAKPVPSVVLPVTASEGSPVGRKKLAARKGSPGTKKRSSKKLARAPLQRLKATKKTRLASRRSPVRQLAERRLAEKRVAEKQAVRGAGTPPASARAGMSVKGRPAALAFGRGKVATPTAAGATLDKPARAPRPAIGLLD